MIRMDGKYRTMEGEEARVYAIDGSPPYSVHGARKSTIGWRYTGWTEDGRYQHDRENSCPEDLIEIKPAAIDQMIAWLDGRVSERRTQGSQADFDYMLALTEARRIKAEAEKEG